MDKFTLKKIILINFTIFLFLAFFSIFVAQGALRSFDLGITNKIQNIISKDLDTPLSLFSIIGTFEVTTLVFIIFLFLRKKKNSILIFLLFFIGSVFEVLGKTFIHHTNPPSRFFRYDLNFIFPSSYVQTGYSFPSGHMMRTTFIVVTLLILLFKSKKFNLNKKRIVSFCLILFLVVMAISRISLGEHWTSDVIAGFLLGFGLGLFNLEIL